MVKKHARKVLYFQFIGNLYEECQDLIDGIYLLKDLQPPFHLKKYSFLFLLGTKFERGRIRLSKELMKVS